MSDRIFYITGTGQPGFEVEVPQGAPTIETPFGESGRNHLIISQVYMQRGAAYRRPTENSLCDPSISNGERAYFCDDSARIPVGGADIVTWTRTWATKPDRVIEYTQMAVQMPARAAVFRFDSGTAGAPFTWYPYLVAKSYSLPRFVTILKDYFLIGSNGVGIKCDYSSTASIPSLDETLYAGADVTALGSGPLTDEQMASFAAQNIGNFSGAILQPAWTTIGTGNATYTASSLSSGNYYVGQSVIRRYVGNIWERTATRITL